MMTTSPATVLAYTPSGRSLHVAYSETDFRKALVICSRVPSWHPLVLEGDPDWNPQRAEKLKNCGDCERRSRFT